MEELQRPRSRPPSYSQSTATHPPFHPQHPPQPTHTDSATLDFPAVPRHKPSSSLNLPDLKSLGLPSATHIDRPSGGSGDINGTPFSNPFAWSPPAMAHPSQFPRVPTTLPGTQSTMTSAMTSAMTSPRDSVLSAPDDHPHAYGAGMRRQASSASSVSNALHTISSLSMDDPDVRAAAEALSGLGNPDFFRGSTASPRVARASVAAQGQAPPAPTTPATSARVSPPTAAPSPGAASQRTLVDGDESPEPLFTLLTSSHPLLSSAIAGSMSAYATSKHYSPSFIRSQVERVERAVGSVGSPVVQTVGSVSRRTGVEGAVRRYLKDTAKARRKDGDAEAGESAQDGKRRRVMSIDGNATAIPTAANGDIDVEKGISVPGTPTAEFRAMRVHGSSQASPASRSEDRDSLPAYDAEHRSPTYEPLDPYPVPSEKDQLLFLPPAAQPMTTTTTTTTTKTTGDRSMSRRSSAQRRAWSTQLIMTTSGLGAALSETSLASLRYCLDLLATATERIASVIAALALLVGEFDPKTTSASSTTTATAARRTRASRAETAKERVDADAAQLAARLRALTDDLFKTLRHVIHAVSRYAGGALPENAGALVRRQLLSLPGRWRMAGVDASSSSEEGAATATTAAESNAAEGNAAALRQATKVLAFGREALEMLSQVTLVVGGTVRSAEAWLARMGKRGSVASTAGGGRNGQERNRQEGRKGIEVEVKEVAVMVDDEMDQRP